MLLETASMASDLKCLKIQIYLRPRTLKLDNMRLAKRFHDEIQALASKCSHFLNSTSKASISASKVNLVLGPLRLIFAHSDTRVIAKVDLNHLMTFSQPVSGDLEMASGVKSNFLLSKEGWDYEKYCSYSFILQMCHSWIKKCKKFDLVES